MGKPQAPTPLNPTQIATDQTKSNIDTAIGQATLNSPNQITPWGTSTWTQGPAGPNGVPQWTQNVTLNPWQQNALTEQGVGQLQQATEANDRGTKLNGLLQSTSLKAPTLQTFGTTTPTLNTKGGTIGNIQKSIPTDYTAGANRVRDAMLARINPEIERDRTRLDTQLANKGIAIGSDAYKAAMDDLNRSINDQRTSVELAAGQEQSRLQGMDLNAGGFANSAQQQAFAQTLANAGFSNEAIQSMFQNGLNIRGLNNDVANSNFQNTLTSRNAGINEVLALRGGGQVQQPQFPGTSQTGVAGTDTSGIATNSYNQAYQQYLQQQQQRNGVIGGLFGLGTNIAMGLSDRRAKEDVRLVGVTFDGQNIYLFRYVGDPEFRVGLMADEVFARDPSAVGLRPDGYLGVDYAKALEAA